MWIILLINISVMSLFLMHRNFDGLGIPILIDLNNRTVCAFAILVFGSLIHHIWSWVDDGAILMIWMWVWCCIGATMRTVRTQTRMMITRWWFSWVDVFLLIFSLIILDSIFSCFSCVLTCTCLRCAIYATLCACSIDDIRWICFVCII